MGLVTPQEADAAVEQARYVPGVTRVVKLFEYIAPDSGQKTPAQAPNEAPSTLDHGLDSEQDTHGSSESDIVEG
jgi:hypothetical protein